MDVRLVAPTHGGKVVFVNIAENPDIAQVGYGERVRRAQTLNTGRTGNLLIGYDPGYRRTDINNSRRLIYVRAAQNAEFFSGGFHVDLGLGFGILRNLLVVHRDGSPAIQVLRSFGLCAGKLFVGNRLLVIRIGARDIRTLYAEQHLTLLNEITQAGFDLHDAPGGQRYDRDGSGNVRIDRGGDLQFRMGHMFDGRRQRKLIRMLYLENVRIFRLDDLQGWWSPGARIFFGSPTAEEEGGRNQRKRNLECKQQMSSVPHRTSANCKPSHRGTFGRVGPKQV